MDLATMAGYCLAAAAGIWIGYRSTHNSILHRVARNVDELGYIRIGAKEVKVVRLSDLVQASEECMQAADPSTALFDAYSHGFANGQIHTMKRILPHHNHPATIPTPCMYGRERQLQKMIQEEVTQ